MAPSPSVAADSLTGQVLNQRYEILRELGRGSFATAYQAIDRQTGQTCVVKQLSLRTAGSWKDVELFQRESQVLASLDHPRIPKHRAFFAAADESAYFLVQDYIRGNNLGDVLAANKRLMANQVLRIAEDVADILAYLHRRRPAIVHRDLKPGNIILGPGQRAYLIDFGAVDNDGGRDGEAGSTVVGSYGYMPYEQFSGVATPASDVYALGATMIHLLSGRPPSAFMDDGLHLDVSRAVKGSERLQALLARMVDPDWQKRFQDGVEVRAALKELSRPPATPRTRQAAVITATLGLLALSAIGVASWRYGQQNRPAAPVRPAAVTAPLDRNLLAPESFGEQAGWQAPYDTVHPSGQYLRLWPGQMAYRDIDLRAYQATDAGKDLWVSVVVRAHRTPFTKAALALWSEPDGKLLGEDTRDIEDPTQIIGRTVVLPKDGTSLRLALYGLSTGRSGPQFSSSPVTYYEPEVIVHTQNRVPAVAHLALGRPLPAVTAPPGNDAAWRQMVARRRMQAQEQARLAAIRPSASAAALASPKPTPTPLPAILARRPSPKPRVRTEKPYRWYDWSGVNSVGNVPHREETVRRYEPPPARVEPTPTPLTFPDPTPITTRIWIPRQEAPAPLAPVTETQTTVQSPNQGAVSGFQRP